jgi:hypothetical protein
MRRALTVPVLLAGIVGLALLAVGIVYLTVACQELPGLLGPTRGDTSPRTGLGIVGVLLGVAVLIVALLVPRRRPPSGPLQS